MKVKFALQQKYVPLVALLNTAAVAGCSGGCMLAVR